jgi:hypothetical protein
MKQVQLGLSGLGIPVFAGIWRPTPGSQNPPAQYAVYATTTTEDAHQDDQVTAYKTLTLRTQRAESERPCMMRVSP